MTLGSDSDATSIDPKLVKNFALFREPVPGPDGPLDEAQWRAIEFLSRRGTDFVLSRTVKVVLDEGLTMLVVPGLAGVPMLAPDRDGRFNAAVGANTEALLEGRPVGSFGSLVFGLAVDGDDWAPVRLADGSAVRAAVKRNVYAIADPSRQ